MEIQTIQPEKTTPTAKNWLGAITDFVQPDIQMIPQEQIKPVIEKPDYTPIYVMGIVGIISIVLIFMIKKK